MAAGLGRRPPPEGSSETEIRRRACGLRRSARPSGPRRRRHWRGRSRRRPGHGSALHSRAASALAGEAGDRNAVQGAAVDVDGRGQRNVVAEAELALGLLPGALGIALVAERAELDDEAAVAAANRPAKPAIHAGRPAPAASPKRSARARGFGRFRPSRGSGEFGLLLAGRTGFAADAGR